MKKVVEIAIKNELLLALNSRRPPRAGRSAWCEDWRGFQLASPCGHRYFVIVQLTDEAHLVADLMRGRDVRLGRPQVSLGRPCCFAAIADQVDGAVKEDELPIDCATVSPRVRQALLVLVPLRLTNERTGLQLAGLRQDAPSLPFNPVLAYDQHTQGNTPAGSKLSQEERERYAWFLEQATFEQIVEVMDVF